MMDAPERTLSERVKDRHHKDCAWLRWYYLTGTLTPKDCWSKPDTCDCESFLFRNEIAALEQERDEKERAREHWLRQAAHWGKEAADAKATIRDLRAAILAEAETQDETVRALEQIIDDTDESLLLRTAASVAAATAFRLRALADEGE